MSFLTTRENEKHWQLSESFFLVSFLAIVGGYLDAYTYISRGYFFLRMLKLEILLSWP